MRFFIVAAALLLTGCATVPPPRQPGISEAEIRATMAVLASDSFEGRMVETPGEAKTIAYLAERFRAAGTFFSKPRFFGLAAWENNMQSVAAEQQKTITNKGLYMSLAREIAPHLPLPAGHVDGQI